MKTKILFIIGRFQPFHLGHLAIIKKYNSLGYFIKIGVGSSQKSHEKNNPFTSKEREEMIKTTLKDEKIKKFKIFHIPDIKEDKKYAKHVEQIVGHFDILFTGNPSVKTVFDKFCSIKGCKIHFYKERIKRVKAGNIRKLWIERKRKSGLPHGVYSYLQKIRASDRLKEMHDNSKKVHYILRTNNLTISTAESCTGGEISRSLISYSGSSSFFKLGIVAYDISSKIKRIGVSKNTIAKKGSISKETTIEMAEKVRKLSGANFSIASTGYADPSDKKAGMIFIVISSKKNNYLKVLNIKLKNRNKIIDSATKQAIKFLYECLRKELEINYRHGI